MREPLNPDWVARIKARIPNESDDPKHPYATDWFRTVKPIRQHIRWLHEGLDGWSMGLVMDDNATEGSGIVETVWAHAQDEAALDRLASRLTTANLAGYSIHLGVGLRKEKLKSPKRGGYEDIKMLPAIWAEIDGGDPAIIPTHASLPEPTFIYKTSNRDGGGGWQIYWLLSEPTDQLKLAQNIMLGIALILGGEDDDDTGFKSWMKAEESITPYERNLRLPGSYNRKPSRNNERVELGNRPDLSHTLYTLDDFLHLDPGEPEIEKVTTDRSQWIAHDKPNPDYVTAEDIVNMVGGSGRSRPRRTKDGWMVCCPAHGDRSPSLFVGNTVYEGADKTHIHCFANCSFASIIKALGLRASDLYSVTSIDPRQDPEAAKRMNRMRRAGE